MSYSVCQAACTSHLRRAASRTVNTSSSTVFDQSSPARQRHTATWSPVVPRHRQNLKPRRHREKTLAHKITASTTGPSSNLRSQSLTEDAVFNLKLDLVTELDKVAPNGLNATQQDQERIQQMVSELEALNATTRPAYSGLMAGFWKMLYTDMEPAPSSGKLGPFTGAVYQDLRPEDSRIVNMLKVGFPPIRGGLRADLEVSSDDTWRITFDDIQQYLGPFRVQTKEFDKAKPEVRLWKITYLDEEMRILRAKKEGDSDDGSFIFVLTRCEAERFALGE